MEEKKILVVDDSVYMRAVLKDLLERNGYKVIGMAENGEVAVEMYIEMCMQGRKPDLVLMDVSMKKMNGIEALKRIKEFDAESNVVMISSIGSKNALVDAVKAGAKYFIHKPFEDEKLLKTVEQVLSNGK